MKYNVSGYHLGVSILFDTSCLIKENTVYDHIWGYYVFRDPGNVKCLCYNLIGIGAVPQLVERLHLMFYCLIFQRLQKSFCHGFDWNECKYKQWTFFLMLSKCKLHWVASKVYMSLIGIHSLCTQPNVVYTSINLRKMKFFPLLKAYKWHVYQYWTDARHPVPGLWIRSAQVRGGGGARGGEGNVVKRMETQQQCVSIWLHGRTDSRSHDILDSPNFQCAEEESAFNVSNVYIQVWRQQS